MFDVYLFAMYHTVSQGMVCLAGVGSACFITVQQHTRALLSCLCWQLLWVADGRGREWSVLCTLGFVAVAVDM
jgi:hypothetical protein